MVARRSDSDLSKANLYYDSQTGQVYTEAVVTAKAIKSKHSSSSLPRLGRVRDRFTYSGAPLSLEKLATNAVFDNVESLTPETLECVPWPIKKRLWDASKGSLSTDQRLHLWKLLVANGHRDSRLSYRRISRENQRDHPLMPLPHYLPNMNSPTCSWITALTISKLNIPRAHLYQLAGLANLVALDICAVPEHDLSPIDQPLVDNHVMKHFAAHADCAGAFQSLRVLILREFNDVTRDCLRFLNSFPRLSLFGVQNCGIGRTSLSLNTDEQHARRHGWTSEDERGLLRQLQHEIAMTRTWDGMLRACVDITAAFEQPAVESLEDANCTRWNRLITQQDTSEMSPLERSKSLGNDVVNLPAFNPHFAQKENEPRSIKPQPDPPLLNYKIGLTCSGVVFTTPTVFFRCVNGHIQEQRSCSEGRNHVNLRDNGAGLPRSESKSRRPSGPYELPPTKRPKLKAGRKVEVNRFLEMEGVGRSLSCVELKGKRGR